MEETLNRLRQALVERYRILRELGRGGMAVVYLADDLKLDRKVALKVLLPEVASVVGPERFAREVRITAHLQHPHILQLLDAGEAGGLPYYVMPYVEGESLAERLKREQQLPVEQAVRIACDVADALTYAHSLGVVHRDIKPQNILLSGDDAVVADFGIARALDAAGGEALTATGIAIGTVSYMSPEQASARDHVDARSDIYSLGCVLYEMLTGQPPFTGPTAQAILARQSAEAVPSIRVVRETVSQALEQVIVKSLAKVPADRYATGQQLRDALERAELVPASTPVWLRPRVLTAAAATAVVVVGAAVLRDIRTGPPIDPDRIVVFPLVGSASSDGGRRIGEDVATMIGHALDGTGPLRWIDGWTLLDDDHRNNIRGLRLSTAKAIARRQRSRFFVTGRIAERRDSADVYLELYDVTGDSSLAKAHASAELAGVWRAGLRAVNDLLPQLIPTSTPDVPAHWADRRPTAVASFLLGERDFRRGRFDDAMEHYAQAVRSDSSFALAAIRGAQAAGWHHYSWEARSFIRLALEHADQLPEQHAAFARGYEAFLAGKADSAIQHFRAAIDLDPDMAIAWSQLGDVYTHLLPRAGQADSLAEAALLEAYRLDSTATHLAFHLAESALRKGEVGRAFRFKSQLMAGDPDTAFGRRIEVMSACVSKGLEAVDWGRVARHSPLPLVSAGKSLATGAGQLACAERAFRAVLEGDTATDAWGVGRRWSGVVGLQSILAATGREAAAVGLVDSVADGEFPAARVLLLLDAAAGADLWEQAAQVAETDRERYGPDYRGAPTTTRLWVLGVWEAAAGRAEMVEAIAKELAARAGASETRRDRLMADAMAAHAALAVGDSGLALQLFGALVPTSPPDSLTWHLAEPLGPERLVLARLLLAEGRPREAYGVAAVFDSPDPLLYLIFIPASLALRAEAAEAMGNPGLAARMRARYRAVRGEVGLQSRQGVQELGTRLNSRQSQVVIGLTRGW